MKEKEFPAGWDEGRVKRVVLHYEQQSDEEAIAEDEAAFEESAHALVSVPDDLLPAVRELIAKHDAKDDR
jgi:type II secretory pathway component PulC